MFEQLLINKNKIATVLHSNYYAELVHQLWHLNEAYIDVKNVIGLLIRHFVSPLQNKEFLSEHHCWIYIRALT
jgi:hypothetical protein